MSTTIRRNGNVEMDGIVIGTTGKNEHGAWFATDTAGNVVSERNHNRSTAVRDLVRAVKAQAAEAPEAPAEAAPTEAPAPAKGETVTMTDVRGMKYRMHLGRVIVTAETRAFAEEIREIRRDDENGEILGTLIKRRQGGSGRLRGYGRPYWHAVTPQARNYSAATRGSALSALYSGHIDAAEKAETEKAARALLGAVQAQDVFDDPEEFERMLDGNAEFVDAPAETAFARRFPTPESLLARGAELKARYAAGTLAAERTAEQAARRATVAAGYARQAAAEAEDAAREAGRLALMIRPDADAAEVQDVAQAALAAATAAAESAGKARANAELAADRVSQVIGAPEDAPAVPWHDRNMTPAEAMDEGYGEEIRYTAGQPVMVEMFDDRGLAHTEPATIARDAKAHDEDVEILWLEKRIWVNWICVTPIKSA